MLWFCDLFLSISSLFKISKISLWKFFGKWKFLCKVEKGVILTSDYICLQKMKKVPFLSIGSCSDKTEKGTLFLSILLSLNTIGKGVKFQDITRQGQPLQTQLLMTLIIAILFTWLSSVHKMRISILFFVINNAAKSLKELVFDSLEWNCWMFWNMVASIGAKYILKYNERLGKQESHLSADRWSLTNKKSPTFPYRLLCFPVGIPYSLQETIVPYCKGIPLRILVAAVIKVVLFHAY